MIFNSFPFLLGFLPIAITIYFFAARHEPVRLPVLFALSVVFYGWWSPPLIFLLLGSILVNWIAANLFVSTGLRAIPTAAIVLNLAILAFFKYLGFLALVAQGITDLSIEPINLVLPLGISFFTFHHIMYLADLRAGKTTAFPLVHYALYIGFFPQVLAGPLVRYHEVMDQWRRPPFGSDSPERIGRGMVFIVLGLVEKVLLGDPLADVVNPIYQRAAEISSGAAAGAALGVIEAWMAAIGFGLQIYFDFAGYSHIAVGLALIFGISLPQNFNAPYRATSLREFWRRWHMTLSRFLRDYVYVTLGGNRQGLAVQIYALMITMALAGLWHGAGWAFVLWGSLHGLVLSGGVLWRRFMAPMPAPIGWLLTFLFVMSTWPLFRAQSVAAALPVLESLMRIGEAGPVPDLRPFWPAAAVALLAPTTWMLATRGRPHPVLALVLAVLFVAVLTQIGEDTTYEFVYFQF